MCVRMLVGGTFVTVSGEIFGHNQSKILVFPSSSALHVEILWFFFG